MTETLTFFNTVYGSKPDDLHILLWEKLDKKLSYWFREVDKAAEFAAAHNINIYIGVNLSPKAYGLHYRCKAAEISAQCAFIADIDIAGPAHKSERLPATMEEARLILPAELKPTLLVDSGNGLQGWWVLRDPVVFASDDQRKHSQRLAVEWHRAMERTAEQHGWKLDAVHDLSRVLRLPNSVNRKENVPDKQARILEISDNFYRLAEIEEYLAPLLHSEKKPPLVVSTSIQTTAGEAQHLTLSQVARGQRIDPYLLIGWALEKITDGTESGRNAAAFWLLCQFRDNGYSFAEAVAFGPHYVQLVAGINNHAYTLREYMDSARSAYSRPARESLVDAITHPGDDDVEYAREVQSAQMHHEHEPEQYGPEDREDANDDDDDDDRPENPTSLDGPAWPKTPIAPAQEARAAREVLTRLIGLTVEKVEKHGSVKGHYRIHIVEGRQFDIGDAKVLDSQTAFRVAVIDGLGRQIPRLARKRWDQVVQAILTLTVIVETLTPYEMLQEELESYLMARGWCCDSLDSMRGHPKEMLEWFVLVKSRGVAICEMAPGGRLILRLRDFVAWVHQNTKTNLTALEFANLLSQMGFTKVTTIASATFNGSREKLHRLWVIDRAALPFEITDMRKHRAEFMDADSLALRWVDECIDRGTVSAP